MFKSMLILSSKMEDGTGDYKEGDAMTEKSQNEGTSAGKWKSVSR